MERLKHWKHSIKPYEIVDYMMEYGKNREVFKILYEKLEQDLHQYSMSRRQTMKDRAKVDFDNNLKFMNNSTYNLLDFLCIIARMEKDNRISITKYQFYHLFHKILY